MRLAGWVIVAAVATGLGMRGSGPAALAQLSPEGERRLDERQTGKPAKRGATTRSAGKAGARQPVFLWRTKPNAPWLYRAWVKRFPEIRRQNVAAYQDALDRELDILRRIQLRPVQRIYGKQYENGWKPSKVDSARKRKELSTQDAIVAAMDQRIQDMANDPLYVPFPGLEFSDEAFGRLDKPVRIIGIADKSTCFARVEDQRFWLSGFDTTSFAEGQNVVVEVPLIVSGVRPFTDDEGQTRSYPVVKPFDWVPYLEKYEVTAAEAGAFWGPPIPPPPPKRLAVGPPPRAPDLPGGPPVGIIQPVQAKKDVARKGERGKTAPQ